LPIAGRFFAFFGAFFLVVDFLTAVFLEDFFRLTFLDVFLAGRGVSSFDRQHVRATWALQR